MKSLNRSIIALGVIATIALGSTQSVMAAAWTNAAGVAPSGHFTWSNGGDVNGFFGSPTVTLTDRFVFNVGGFGVNDPAGDASSTVQTDTVSWDLDMSPGFQLTGMEVRVRGSYLVNGVGSYVDVQGTLSITEFAAQGMNPNPRNWNAPIVLATPGPAPITSGQGLYSGVSTIDISFEFPAPDDQLHISFANLLEAFAVAGGNASVNQQFQNFELEVMLIPEPATLSLLGLGAAALIRRRR